MKGLLLGLMLFCLQTSALAQTYYVLRHFEKAPTPDDPPLSTRGIQQANALAALLNDKDIQCIYSTNYQRTLQSVTPLANALSIKVQLYDPRQPEKLINSLTTTQGDCVIVGHSNTVPDLVERLGGTGAPLTEKDYGDVFILVKDKLRLLDQHHIVIK
ncbi:SixA phosphatase family protein [Alteromonas flava]|uniref:SixA phosphatase family protein n=1 Tax=Alteromonas flava TaxID=2048003 RepID=UPI000C28217F|nr:histidine phosphatase family protein [Alteromonas flava]